MPQILGLVCVRTCVRARLHARGVQQTTLKASADAPPIASHGTPLARSLSPDAPYHRSRDLKIPRMHARTHAGLTLRWFIFCQPSKNVVRRKNVSTGTGVVERPVDRDPQNICEMCITTACLLRLRRKQGKLIAQIRRIEWKSCAKFDGFGIQDRLVVKSGRQSLADEPLQAEIATQARA